MTYIILLLTGFILLLIFLSTIWRMKTTQIWSKKVTIKHWTYEQYIDTIDYRVVYFVKGYLI